MIFHATQERGNDEVLTNADAHFVYFKTSNERLANELGATYMKAKKEWRVPKTLGALRELWKAGIDVQVIGKTKAVQYDRALADKKGDQDLMQRMNAKLRPYQKADASFLLQRNNLACFNSMRTGKTPTLCEVLEKRKKKTVIVCPSSLVLNWRGELGNWTTAEIFTVKGTPKKREDIYLNFHKSTSFAIMVISKDTVRQDIAKLQSLDFKVLLVDEAHFLRNRQSKQSEALYTLAKNATYRYALTGTPATNSPTDVYGILKFLEPTAYPSYWQFVERYFVVDNGHFGKTIGDFKNPARKKEFKELVETISTQRKLEDVMIWLPKTQHQVIPLEMDSKQRKAYDSMLNDFETEDISASGVLAQLTRLRQLTVAPKMLGIDTPSVKEKFIVEWIENNPTEQVLIFSNFTSYLQELRKLIPQALMITGRETQEERHRNVKIFQQGKCKVLLINIEAGGTGLTLDKAGTCIFLDRSYNPSSNEQAEARMLATTKTSNLSSLVIDLVCEGTIDEKIIQAVQNKQNITKIVNNYKSVKYFIKAQ